MRRTAEEAQQTREAVFQAGLRVFSRKGFEGATLADVAREAGVTRGAIYWHFTNKEAFFEEVVGRLERFYDDLLSDPGMRDDPTVETVCRAVRTVLERFCSDDVYRSMQILAVRGLLHAGTNPDLHTHISQRFERESPVLQRAGADLAHLARAGLPEPLVPLRAYLFGVFIALSVHESSPTEAELDSYIEFLRGALSRS